MRHSTLRRTGCWISRASTVPKAFALLTHGSGGEWFRQLVTSFGTANIGVPSYALCRGPVETGFFLTFGASPPEVENTDMRNSRCITLIGTHLGENMHNTQVQEFAQGLENGARLIVVDPRFSVAASKAHYWLSIKPGSDLALLLAWMNVIIEEKLYDAEYITQYTIGFEEVKKHVTDKTPEWAYGWTGIKPNLIRETGRLIGASRPASLIHCGRRVTWYGDDTQRLRAVAMLNALIGAWGRKGGYYLPAEMELPPYPYKKPDYKPKAPVDQPKNGGYPFAESILVTGLRDASIPGNAAYDLHGWMVYGTNPFSSMPQPKKTIEAIQHLDFLVTIDNLPMEIAGWSDIVLPECTYLERYDDLKSPPFREPFVAMRQKAIEPMYDSKPPWWIARELASRLGTEETCFPWKDVEEYLKVRVRGASLDWDTLKKKGVIRGKVRPIYFEEGAAPVFDTPSHKIELYSDKLRKAGFDPMPQFRPAEEPPEGMFRLLSGRSPVHSFGRTVNNRLLGDCYSENEVWLNDRICEELGIKDKQKVLLVGSDGVKSNPVRVKKTRRIRPDCVFLVHGFGRKQERMEFAYNKGASAT